MKFKFDRIGVTQLQARFGRLRATVNSNEVPHEIVRKGVKFAKTVAPGPSHGQMGKRRATGALVKGIRGVFGTKRAGVISETPRNPDGRLRPYNLWMHDIGVHKTRSGKYMPKSGKPAYMFATKRYMEKLIKREYKQSLQ